MAVFKCKMCGGDLEITEESKVAECIYCGTKQTVPSLDNEKKISLFTRANKLRAACDFDKAAGIYESIVTEFPDEAEAYWGLILCKYGIEYVDDPLTGKKIPTCHRSSFDALLDSNDFEMVMENADIASRKVYREEAKVIEDLRKSIVEISAKEEPYDIFICYKETDENGSRTIDSVIAQDVYNELTSKGYRVFFSRITLEDKLGQEYEPYIFAALNSARIMLAFGTDYEYYNSVWVKNEWSRFLQLIAKGEKKTLIPCYKNIDAYDMPKEFAKLQAQDMGKVGAIQDLLRGIEKIIPKNAPVQVKETIVVNNAANVTVDSLLKRVFMFLGDGEWVKADEYCEKVLDVDPENAQAYLGKLFVDLKVRNTIELSQLNDAFDNNSNYVKLIRFADKKLRIDIENIIDSIILRKNSDCLKIIDGVVVGCDRKVSAVAIPEGIIGIAEKAFMFCKNLTKIIIPHGVEYINKWAFYGCESLSSIILPDSVSVIDDRAFCNCKSLEAVQFSDGIERIGASAFYGCDALKDINLPDSVCEIGGWAFANCKSLETIYIPANVKNIGVGIVSRCYALKDFSVAENNEKYAVLNGCLIDTSRKEIVSGTADFKIPDDGSIISIGDYAFSSLEELKTITIPGCVTDIGTGAFSGCNYLDEINISGYSSKFTVKDGCLIDVEKNELLTTWGECIIPDDGSVKTIKSDVVANVKSLKGVIIPGTIESVEESAFSGCEVLKKVSISEGVKKIGNSAFSFCSAIEELTVPGSVEIIEDSTFMGCDALKTVCICEGVCEIGMHAFSECGALTSIVIPSTIKKIGHFAFENCDELINVDFAEGITSLDDYAFCFCKKLTTVIIPASVISISSSCFDLSLKMVYSPIASYAEKWAKEHNIAWEEDELSKQERLAEEKRIEEEKHLAEEKRIAEEKQRVTEQKLSYCSKGLCQHCGGTFKGLFAKKCVNCGKEKDY